MMPSTEPTIVGPDLAMISREAHASRVGAVVASPRAHPLIRDAVPDRLVGMSTPPPVLVVDFGAQYAQLIARRVREANVYSELVPHSMPVEQMLAKRPAAIILSGGPSS